MILFKLNLLESIIILITFHTHVHACFEIDNSGNSQYYAVLYRISTLASYNKT